MLLVCVRNSLSGDSVGTSTNGCEARDVVDARPLSVWEDALRDGAAVDVRAERVAPGTFAGILSS